MITPRHVAPVAAPHAAGANSVARVMLWVAAALLPATLFGFWLYGWPALHLWWITTASAILGEALCLRLRRQPVRASLRDASALLTGWLLALSLPPWAPWWIGVVGGLFATVIGKQVFGGLGQNLFNPAMVARVMLLISFPVPMTLWTAPIPLLSANAPGFVDGLRITFGTLPAALDAMSSATLFGYARSELSRGVDLLQSLAATQAPPLSLVGERAGSMGETASLLLAAGGLLLLGLRLITWHIPFAMLATLALLASLMHGSDPARYLSAGTHLLSGGAMLGAFFIATDYVTSPNTSLGQFIFGAGVGFLTYVIRTWGGYPEGVAFAVLLMNALTPVIDRYVKPRIYGRDRHGRPLEIES
ncbi:RnfABCDGE type electron transport complex subunit D [Accumulibacter sp.]|uniref:RnfABCDGE type electron transport complex subunit D n=1 Tax=Accumulibacter sp. TaxID=2053492 RepID=UPI0025E5E6E1|nr:RnfABCDGE type electron transport complex subunit D [Accumulibacter sp.]MCM8611884.1 RnfABCDGE type electron transport complex subunit D [Accumulibacter sp.]MCM8635506.1 RnfABCDGE type electron transport complex subunit D [Accumulibacter sp.]MCM8639084.1 RnfABCDGE type electron transport complex subunit D [Accumulibacter sp.]